MTVPLPTEQHVKATMDEVLAEAARTGQRATVAAVEHRLGIAHATFHRHYSHLIDTHFKPCAADLRRVPADPAAAETDQQTMARLRRENTDLRKLLDLYSEQIRQLTIDNQTLTRRLENLEGVPRIGPAPS